MILTESEIEQTALDMLEELNGYQVAFGPDLADGVYDAHCPALREGRIRAGSVRAGSIRANPVGAGSEPAPTMVIREYPEPATICSNPTNQDGPNLPLSNRATSVRATSVRAGSQPAPTAVIDDYPEPAPTTAIHEYPKPAPTFANIIKLDSSGKGSLLGMPW
jgi:hypothetical protein